LNGISHCLSALGRKLLHLPVHLPRKVLLLRGQMTEGVHAAQHLLPLRGGQAIEAIKLILQTLSLLLRKAAELRVALQSPSLLLRRQIVMLTQPLSGVTLLRFWGTGNRTGDVLFPATVLRPRRSNPAQRQGKSHYRAYRIYPHFPPVY
jgi:hypothetical protein